MAPLPDDRPQAALAAIERIPFRLYAMCIAAVTVLFVWAPRLFIGLWLDETYTYWLAHLGWRTAVERGLSSAGQSPLYSFIASFFLLEHSHHMELVLRLPSVAAMAAAAFLLYRLAEDWFGEHAGWLAVVIFVTQRNIVQNATQARPYAMAIAACIGMIYGLHVSLSRGRAYGWALFVICAAAIPYLQLLFCVFFATPAAYVVLRVFERHKIPWLRLAGAVTLIVAAWLPLPRMIGLVTGQGRSLSMTPVPSPDDLMAAILPPTMVFAGFLAVIALEVFCGDSFAAAPKEQGRLALLGVLCAISGPLALFLGSHIKGYGFMLERYMLYAIAGLVLFTAFFFVRLQKKLSLVVVLLCFSFVSLGGALMKLWRGGETAGSWKETLAEVTRLDPEGKVPVLVQSGFPESNFQDWEHSLNESSHLYSPLIPYPLLSKTYPLPGELDDRTKVYVEGLLGGELRGHKRIIGVFTGPAITEWVTSTLEARHYRVAYSNPGYLPVFVFESN